MDKRNSNLTFIGNFFTNNSSPAGGGMSIATDNFGVDLRDNIFYKNFALVDAGGLYSHDSTRMLTLTNDIFDDNKCGYRGGGELNCDAYRC